MTSQPAERYRGRRVLVTGGVGFIGSAIAAALVDAGAHVTIIDSLEPDYGGNWQNVADFRDLVDVHVADIRTEEPLHSLVAGQDVIFNLAAQIGHLASMQEPLVDLDINARAQLALLEACRALNPTVRIVFASTRQVYGRPQYLPVDEAHPIVPVDVNGVDKLAAEHFHLLYQRVYGIPTTVLRLTNTYGPRMRIKDARQTFVGVWIRAVLEGRPFEVWGGQQQRDLTYVDDAVDAFLRAGASDATIGETYNIGGGEVVTLAQLGDALIAANAGGSYTIHEIPPERKRIDIGDFHSDASRFARATGWAPRTPLRDGLAQALAYYRTYLPSYV